MHACHLWAALNSLSVNKHVNMSDAASVPSLQCKEGICWCWQNTFGNSLVTFDIKVTTDTFNKGNSNLSLKKSPGNQS